MNRFIAAAVAALALFTATSASADTWLLDRQIVAKNGNVLGTLYLVVNDEDEKPDAFVVMEGEMAFPPPMDFVVLAPNVVAGQAPSDAALRQVNNWKLRPGMLHKGVDDSGECRTIYKSLYRVSPVTIVNQKYRPTNEFVALMGERNACASEGRLRWFVDAAQVPENNKPMPQVHGEPEDLYFEVIEEFGPFAPLHDWYARSWLPAG